MFAKVRLRRALLVLLLLLPATIFADPPTEDSVKAGFVLNFARYAEWPAALIASGELKICWLGSQTLSGKLAELDGTKTRGLVVRVQQTVRPEDWRECHVLFIPASETHRMTAILHTLEQTPVLTVSDSPDFIEAGGMIGLKTVNGRIRFDISQRAVHRTGLSLSSRLLTLADGLVQ